MKNRMIILSWFMLVINFIYSQNFCFTPASTNNLEFNNAPQLRATNDSHIYILKIYFHVIRRSNGTGGQSIQNVQEAYNVLNSDYNSHKIFFSWDGTIDYIDDDLQYNTPNTSIYSVNNHQDGIDIYLYDDTASAGGRANGVGESTEFWVSGTYWKTPFQSLVTSHVISHEMGHVLFLWHTHHGTFDEGGNDNPCAELVDGSNSSTCGDYVVDTPADPHLNFDVNSTCQWNGSTRDANGHLYRPNGSLIMSYTDVGCMEYFSLKQGERMRNAVETLPHLQRTLVGKYLEPSISGPSTICDQATYTIDNLPAGATVTWSASNNNLVLLSQQGNKAIFRKNLNGTGSITARISINGKLVVTRQKNNIQLGTLPVNFGLYDVSWGRYIEITEGNVWGVYVFKAEKSDGLANNNLKWEVVSPNGEIAEYTGHVFGYSPTRQGYHVVTLSITDQCNDNSGITKSYYFKESHSFSLFPNPAINDVTIQLQEEPENTDNIFTQRVNKTAPSGVIEIQLWSATALVRTYKTEQSTYQISVADLPKGMYFVRVIKDGQIHTQKLIKN